MNTATLDATVEGTPTTRTIFGFTRLELAGVLMVFALLAWVAWATMTLLELRQRRVVTVSLATIVKDFVAAEARTASSPEEAAARTKAYLAATDAAIRSLAADGNTVLVAEAVVGNSVPDLTGAVSAAVNAAVARPARPASAVPVEENGNGH